ncbi:MAG: histidine phosphatase family protein [Rickettsiales bacterium]
MSKDFPLGKKFYVMRHAETEDNKSGVVSGSGREPELTEKGKQQAVDAREILERINQPINLIVTSALKRTKDTAKIICDTGSMRDVPRIVDEGINERAYGEAEGMSEVEVRKLKSHNAQIAGSEEKNVARERAVAAVKRSIAVRKNIDGDKTTLFITHGGIVARLLGVALGGEEAVDKMKKYGDLIGRGHAVKNCGIYEFTTPKTAGGEWEVNELMLDNNKQIKRDSVQKQVTIFQKIASRSSELGVNL